jgi:GT2 family glycosyltransferase
MAPVTVVIVNYNSGAHLERALESVRSHAPGATVVVVDNASNDGSEHAAENRSGVTLIRHPRNVGFGAGVNLAANSAPGGSPLLLLNPDGALTAGAVDALRRELEGHPECAIAAPTIRNEDGSLQGNVRGDPTMLTGLFGRTTLLTRLLPNLAVAQRQVVTAGAATGDSRTADWVSGACMLIRREAFAAAAGFDEDYFLFWEDADLCRRLRRLGYTVRYVPDAEVVHRVGGSSGGPARARTIREFHRSAYHYYRTHVARRPLSRATAWLLLAARCRWKLARLRLAQASSPGSRYN